MSKSNGQSPKVTSGIPRLPLQAAEAFASRAKGSAGGPGREGLIRIARLRETCATSRS